VSKRCRITNLEAVLREVAGCSVYSQLDFFSGYWHLKLEPSIAEYFSIITPDRDFTPTRVPQGAVNAVAHFQSTIASIFAPVKILLQYLDDFLLAARSEKTLLTNQTYAMPRIQLNPASCEVPLLPRRRTLVWSI
jgi:Reverse transcriptase (RNA-dependent DNA polymerase)